MIRLVLTCSACPEQYDAFDGDKLVGYLRLRHGQFRVDVPYGGGTTIYQATPNGDGSFDKDERDYYLKFAVAAIESWIKSGYTKPEPPDVKYEMDGDPEDLWKDWTTEETNSA